MQAKLTNLKSIPFEDLQTIIECVAASQSGTAIFVPVINSFETAVLILLFVGAKKSSVTAIVPTTSPVTNLGSISFFKFSSPYLIIASENK